MTTRRNAGTTGTRNAKDVATRNPELKKEEEKVKEEKPKNAKDVSERVSLEGEDGKSNLKSLQGLAPKGLDGVIDEVMKENEMEDKPVVMQSLDTDTTTRRDVIISQFKRMYKTDDVIRVIELLINEDALGKYDFTKIYTDEDEDDFDEACQGLMYNFNNLTKAKPKDMTMALVLKAHLIMPQSFSSTIGYLKDCGVAVNKQLKDDVDIPEMIKSIIEEMSTIVEMSKLAVTATKEDIMHRIEDELSEDSMYKKEVVKAYFNDKYVA